MLPLEDDFCDIMTKAMRGRESSIEALAIALHQTQEHVSRWSQGQQIPANEQIAQIAELLNLDQKTLYASAHKSWHPHLPLPSSITAYQQIPHVSNGYILESADELAIIDPAGNARIAIQTLEKSAKELRYILVTHRHADHCDAVTTILEHFPEAHVLIHPIELQSVPFLQSIAQPIEHLQQWIFGTDAIEAIVLPGHTDGLTCFRFKKYLFVGDALFAGSIGKNFGPLVTYSEQLANVKQLLETLPEDTIIFPGHGPITTLGLEKHHNPFLCIQK